MKTTTRATRALSGTDVARVDDDDDDDDDRTLRVLLRMNAAFSAVTGAIALVSADRVAHALGIDNVWVVQAIGLGLLVYAIDLVVVASLPRRSLAPLGRLASGADAAWVLGTVALIATGAVTGGGAALLVLLSVPVLALAIGQWRAASRLS